LVESQREEREIVSGFGDLITSSPTNKDKWPSFLVKAISALQMKDREKGSHTSDQKFKGLNSRWFGPRKKATDDIEDQTASRQFVIKRDVITITLSGYAAITKRFIVMSVSFRSITGNGS
jgi:hypothetical protein